MGVRKSLNFGGINSADYGVWITGSGTFSSPERDVEYVSVPGRNGDLIIDNNRWNNIEVTYPANIPNGFDAKIQAFRAAMGRKRGYQRLEDDYHLDEYRMASFTLGIQPETIPLNRGGEFDLVFNCKPQRFLKSGDIPLQFMPVHPVSSTLYTGYVPVNDDTLEFTVRCPEDDTLSVTVMTYDEDKEEIGGIPYSCGDGDTNTFTFTAADKFWRIIVTGQDDIDALNIEIKTTTIYNGSPLSINALFGRAFWIQNPTGYACKPMIEVYNGSLSTMTISNYNEGGIREEYYQFGVSSTSADHFFIDCDTQYVYDDAKNNLTNKLTITTAESDIGKALVFPQLGEEKIKLYTSLSVVGGIGLINIYPHWWRL